MGKKLNIRHTIRYMLLLVVIAVLIIISVLNFFSRRANDAAKASGYAQGVVIAELSLSNDISKFVATKDLAFSFKARKDISNLTKQVKKLSAAGYVKDMPQEMKNIKKMSAALNKVIESEKMMGLTENQGMRGKLRNSLQSIESDLDMLKIKTFLIDLFKAEIQAGKFVKHGKMEYVNNWNDAMSTLAITISTNANLSDNTKNGLSKKLRTYMTAFIKYIT